MSAKAQELLLRTQERLAQDSGPRTTKPRSTGITMVLVFDIANNGPAFIAPFSQLVDKVKILDTMWHDDPTAVVAAVEQYRAMDVSVACGGTQFEIALAQDSISDYVALLKELGITEVEVEHHAGQASLDQLKGEVDFFRSEGLSVIGEVGKKWWWKDPTRISRDEISIRDTVEAINGFVSAGADWVYWEGAIVGALIGRQLENPVGQQQLLSVLREVDASKLIFEVYDRRNQPVYPMIAWLVHKFGPNVNLANIEPWLVKRTEWIRHGIMFEMDHPYMRWHADPSAAANWWELAELPDYSIDVQRPFRLSD